LFPFLVQSVSSLLFSTFSKEGQAHPAR
jgi:hypothetical protein